MKMKDLKPVVDVFSECELEYQGSIVLLRDRNGETVGDINFYTGEFTLYSSYEHADKALDRFKELGYDLFDKELNRQLLHAV
ncbi:MAG: hypothetical protein CL666_04700 [Balneola sp.]|nr:hypothetical protein [Balneola sp.]|tara:strand:+ start:46657 stop:46902 length:246 start_codon:yes stop_codon:yes gene_type:complete